MPILNGYESCKQIKKHYDQNSRFFGGPNMQISPVLIAFSGFVAPETEKKCKEYGFDLIL
jgi:CheY-like chemotaxis protein